MEARRGNPVKAWRERRLRRRGDPAPAAKSAKEEDAPRMMIHLRTEGEEGIERRVEETCEVREKRLRI